MYHLVYLTTNLINNKIYVGVHSTYNLDDGYIGTGKNIKKAIKKYGKENFKRDILYYCYDIEHAYEIEKNIVTKSFVNRNDVYNLIEGGRLVHTDIVKFKISSSLLGIKRSDETKSKISESWVTRNKNKDIVKRKNSALKGEETKRIELKKFEEVIRSILDIMFQYHKFNLGMKVCFYNPIIDKQTTTSIMNCPDGFYLGSRQLYKSHDYSNFEVNKDNFYNMILNFITF